MGGREGGEVGVGVKRGGEPVEGLGGGEVAAAGAEVVVGDRDIAEVAVGVDVGNMFGIE